MSANRLAGLSLLTVLGLAGCGDDNPEALTQVSENGLHTNDYFGLSVQKPTEWYAQDFEEMMAMLQMGAKAMSGDDENMRAMIDGALDNTLPLFAFYEAPPGTPKPFNANIQGVAENIESYPGIESGCSYLANTMKLMEQSAMQVSSSGDCTTDTLAGTTMSTQPVRMQMGSMTIRQRYYTCLNGEHAVGFIMTWVDGEQKQKLDGVLETASLACDSP
ncbi:hypothetical protein [Vreelandella utahensis]|uniref:hypothetical protein n=1 Tax=Vreelandella halophila TaxID=86177 RepID=UPI000986857A|nr:hypothetical protein [Halomonas utahensis]